MTSQFEKHARGNPFGEAVLNAAQSRSATPESLSAGQHFSIDADASLDVLWPPADRALNTNNSSMVLRLTAQRRSILFTGDIQQIAEHALSSDSQLRSDVLIAPHHGSSESTTLEFVQAVDPKIIFCSNAKRLTQKQRAFDAMTAKRRVYRTNKSGALTVTIDRDGRIGVKPFLSPGGLEDALR